MENKHGQLSKIYEVLDQNDMKKEQNGDDSFEEHETETASLPFVDQKPWKGEGGIITEEVVLGLYPNHQMLNTLHSENYFGEIALTTNSSRQD